MGNVRFDGLTESPREIFKRVASYAKKAPKVECKPLRCGPYIEDGRSIVALVRTDDRVEGIVEALNLIGDLDSVLAGRDGYVLVKPNLNSDDAFPGSVHPVTLRTVLRLLLDKGVPKDEIVVGDMSGPRWLPTRRVMELNGTLNVVKEFGVRASFFEDEEWVKVKPEKATTWPDGFRLARTVYDASRIISLPCLKTHRYGGVFTLSLKNAVGVINPADRSYLHNSERMRSLIAEINLGYSCDLVVLDGMRCFVSGGPDKGKVASPGVMIAGSDRVAIDAVGVSILKSLNAVGIANVPVKEQEQLKRATEVDLGQLSIENIELKTSNLAKDKEFPKLLNFIENELQ
ncbi:DUF362 domain-containing protein [Candidatus Bathyarchaeota archaeon]|nr:MAG: DUF362 domain-containing protein [Candidatus Bathyarchaeota archaeon]